MQSIINFIMNLIFSLNRINYIILLLPFVGIIATVLGVDSNLINGTVYGKYTFFYISTVLCCLSTLIISFINNNQTCPNTIDLLVFIFIAYVCIHFKLSGAIAENRIGLFILLGTTYFNFRILFNYKFSAIRIICIIFVLLGIIESVWAMLQLYGITNAYNNNFSMTGSFFNPGPLGGYLATIFPMAVYFLLSYRKKAQKNLFSKIYFGTSLCFIILTVLILPSSMSRSAWLALLCGTLYVIISYFKLWDTIRQLLLKSRFRWFVPFGLLMVTLGLAFCAYTLKKGSADSRLLTWKVSAVYLLSNDGWKGSGFGHFSEAYAKAQSTYLANISENDPIMDVLSFPEYGFNEYLQLGIEIGMPGLIIFLTLLFFCFRSGIRKKKYDVVGSLIALCIFAFSSYPFNLLPFCIILVFFIAICSTDNNKIIIQNKKQHYYTILLTLMITIISFIIFLKGYAFMQSVKDWSVLKDSTYENRLYIYQRNYSQLKDQYYFLLSYGKYLSKNQFYSDSNKILIRAKKFSCDPEIYILQGINNQKMGLYREAEINYWEAYNIVPNRIYPIYMLALLYEEEGNIQKMRKMADKVINKKPKFPSKWATSMKEEMSALIRKYEYFFN